MDRDVEWYPWTEMLKAYIWTEVLKAPNGQRHSEVPTDRDAVTHGQRC